MSDPRVRLLFEPSSVAIVGASSDPTKGVGTAAAQSREIEIHRQDLSGQSARQRNQRSNLLSIGVRVTGSARRGDFDGRCQVIAGSPGGVRQERRQDRDYRLGRIQRIGSGRPRAARASGEIAKTYDIRVCGPNCHGTFNVSKNIPCGYDHAYALPIKPGPVAIASHSGALLGVIGHRAVQANLGFSYMVSNGNEMDLDLCDFTEFYLEDENTKVVAVLMEGLKNGPRFLELARARARDRQDHRRAESRQVGTRRDHHDGAHRAHGGGRRSL